MQEKLHELFRDQIESRECFGGAAAVVVNGEVIFNESFGDERFNENSLYRLASVTKIFTATAVMKLHCEGKLDINDKVSKYLPDFARLSIGSIAPNGMIYPISIPKREVTLLDLLTHTAGLGADELGNREYAVMPTEEKVSLEKVTQYYAKAFHLAFEPGSRAAYSGFAGYDVLARIVEILSGKTFNDYLQSEIFAPLGMKDTTFQPDDGQYSRLVPMHQRISGEDREVNFRGNIYRGMPRSYEAAGASLISSMPDILRFCKMLISGGENILTKDAVELMLTPRLTDGLDGLARGENNGIGCFMISGQHRLPKGTVFSHGAYGTHIILHRERNLVAVFLKNSFFDMSVTSRSTVAFENAVLK
ncbi:MAG: beta-lactamase family protein [Clostridia bacterium]|nr:beta-lactamase family protein [Clostridia bacterium]